MKIADLLVHLAWIGAGGAVAVALLSFAVSAIVGTFDRS